MFSLLIPVFNEEKVIERTIRDAETALQSIDEFEIVVINDGSTDRTSEILKQFDPPPLHPEPLASLGYGARLPPQEGGTPKRVRVITHPVNKGYGASMKTGIRHSKGSIIGTVDADGTYPIHEFPALLNYMAEKQADMIVGSRTKTNVQIPLIRRPAKWIIGLLANILTGTTIPDLNSGMRIFTRELAERFMHLYPQKFSFTITITLAALTNDYIVLYHPIDYFKRIGKSTLSSGVNGIKNFLNFLGLIIRIITYFRPLKFFAWPSVILSILGIGTITSTLITGRNISDAGLLLLLTGIQVGFFGMLAEVIVRNRNAMIYPHE